MISQQWAAGFAAAHVMEFGGEHRREQTWEVGQGEAQTVDRRSIRAEILATMTAAA